MFKKQEFEALLHEHLKGLKPRPKDRITEAKHVNAEIISHICTGCLAALSNYATERNIKSYYITELAQMATGEDPSLNIIDNTKKLQKQIMETMSKNPKIMIERYIIKDGKICRI